ncbi:copper chaperone NosL [Daejeonella rubra]|uniref:Copper chaperone NosL n=1 Tax=Daejeonella rubra TaxID=990371 RepID=A0A1G9LR58_9SPHI|nr:nitrous oxide reductase accessory protein NosL [Daejeonella rubra]SDL63935.1 copper chaperone NosL [Daejeonella rubra]
MNNNKIANSSRIALLIAGLSLVAVLFTPIWRIELTAPQYPEGLTLLIHANKLSGSVDIINGLNHYIGMKTLHADDFVEFKVLPGIILFFAALFILSAILAGRKLMYTLFGLFITFGVLAMVDFWRWEYDYGHNLDPNAAIIVPGMAYQPPLIGFKQLLNFGAYSIPDTGGWIFIGAGLILLVCVVLEWKKAKAGLQKKTALNLMVIMLSAALLSSCSTEPVPIRIGKDNCDFCKMTISDKRFGAEIVTKKSKIYKFDDQHCIVQFLKEGKVASEDIAGVYFVDFSSPDKLIDAKKAYFLQSPDFKSPMNGNIAAFSHEDSLAKALPKFYGNAISWEDMQK